MIEQYLNGMFWDVFAAIIISIMGYIALLLRTSVHRMEIYDLAIFGNTETKTSGMLDNICEHEKRLNIHRAALITVLSELTKKGVVECKDDIKDTVKELQSDS